MKRISRSLAALLAVSLILMMGLLQPAVRPVSAASTYQPFTGDFGNGPVGVAASRDRLFVSFWNTGTIIQVDQAGKFTTFSTIPFPIDKVEQYLAMAPTGSAGFTAGNLFVTQGNTIYQITPAGAWSLFTTIPTGFVQGTGIVFDEQGSFGHNMLLTMENGMVWEVDAKGTATFITTVGDGTYGGSGTGTILENPAVAPLSFAPYGGYLLAASENHHRIYAISPSGQVSEVATVIYAEAVHTIPPTVCSYGTTGMSWFVAQYGPLQGLLGFPASDFAGLGGQVLAASEYDDQTNIHAQIYLLSSNGTSTTSTIWASSLGQLEGSTFVDCNVPTINELQVHDAAAPVIAGTAKTQGGGVYTPGTWTNQPVTVTWTCTDEQGGSGIDTAKTTLQPTAVVNTSTTQVASTGDCYDKAGNRAQPATFGPIQIDPVAPTIVGAGTLPGGGSYTPGTWTNQQVSVGFTCTDNTGGSGVKTNAVSTPVSVTTEGQQTVSSSGDCVDQAGNKAQPGSLAVWYDKTPPVITGPANNGLYPVGRVPCTIVADPLSGVASATYTLDGATVSVDANGCLASVPVGQHTLVVTATDKAGNTTTSTVKVIVFANAGAGQFVLGDKTVAAATPSTSVTFWGAQWQKENTLTGGAPNAFKGFDNSAPSLACGATWTTDPGNSSDPPATIPAYMAVIVSSHVDKSGSNISGDIVKIVIVKTDAGYAGNPGHAGTGTIVGTYCG